MEKRYRNKIIIIIIITDEIWFVLIQKLLEERVGSGESIEYAGIAVARLAAGEFHMCGIHDHNTTVLFFFLIHLSSNGCLFFCLCLSGHPAEYCILHY